MDGDNNFHVQKTAYASEALNQKKMQYSSSTKVYRGRYGNTVRKMDGVMMHLWSRPG